MRAAPTSFLFIVLMSLLGALSAFATDMSLAAIEPMARDLAVSPATIGLSLSAFMLSFAISPLVYGPLSDRFGRRRSRCSPASSTWSAASAACSPRASPRC